ncbi:MAG TPA: polysaccharide deacetylase family protein [Bdellovibrio sp.]|uniref:polysaccharide deacetylase family protein n=1 Tax=Bdellovibrio sp. TaxID=28201 RepID=UPI002EE841B2
MTSRSIKSLLSVLAVAGLYSSGSFAQNVQSTEYLKEMKRIKAEYSKGMKQIAAAKNGNEWDERYHQLQGFMGSPGPSALSNQALCDHLKTIDANELEYVGSIIESDATSKSLAGCRTALLNKIQFNLKNRHASFDMESDIANIRPIAFEIREVDENRDRFSYEGLGPKEVMLSFDDGPRASTTPHILDMLKKAGVKAAFFNLGSNALSNKKLVSRVLEEGHILGSHTFTHTLMMASKVRCGKISYDQFLAEMISGHIGVYNAQNYVDPFFRFPNGDADSDMRRNVKELGLKDFRWNADSHDWFYSPGVISDYEKRRQTILRTFVMELKGEKVVDNTGHVIFQEKPASMKDRGIVLFHDIHQQTVDTLPLILNYLADNGYKVVLLTSANYRHERSTVVEQADQYMHSHGISMSQILPPRTADGQVYDSSAFKAKVDFYSLMPQLTKPELVPVGPEVCAMEAQVRALQVNSRQNADEISRLKKQIADTIRIRTANASNE